jgi:hypothetical protein
MPRKAGAFRFVGRRNYFLESTGGRGGGSGRGPETRRNTRYAGVNIRFMTHSLHAAYQRKKPVKSREMPARSLCNVQSAQSLPCKVPVAENPPHTVFYARPGPEGPGKMSESDQT